MLKKIIAIKNVGRFRNSAAQGNPELAKHTLIWGANGFGKTTLCAILRSLQNGDPAHVIGRKTLGVTEKSSVELLVDNALCRFDGAGWTDTLPNMGIFDATFVAENVHSGEVVELDHKRNLYRVIVGQEGVDLAREDARLAGESRRLTGELTAAVRAIQSHVPAGMSLAAFVALANDPDIEAKITEQGRLLEAVRQSAQIQARPLIAEINLPQLPGGLRGLLAQTIEDIAHDAEERLARHLAAHDMTKDGEAWIAAGVAHTKGDTCPFCGQGIDDLPLIATYRAIFSDSYKSLKADIATMRAEVAREFGEGAIGRLNTTAEQIRTGTEFWGRYCEFDPTHVALPEAVAGSVGALGKATLDLLDRKANAPLEGIQPAHAFDRAQTAYRTILSEVAVVNAAIRAANALINARKLAAGASDVRTAEAELTRRKAIKKRHEKAVAALCADHIRLNKEKDDTERCKADIRVNLEGHTAKVMKPYEKRINDYLDVFNAGFRISETKHSYPGGIATSSYQLVINGVAVELGDGSTPTDKPSFKNTLSAGDRTTLALAFFLAHLERDASRAGKIVIFDDPFNSQDAFRRRQTVHEIMRAGRECGQVFVLSHDATFLKQVWDKAAPAERIALQIVDARAQGAKIQPADLAKACQGRVASEIDDLLAFLATGVGRPLDLIKKMRVVLETYCRATYPLHFIANDMLGEIVGKIRDGGDGHLARPLYDELDQINDYTKQYHHGEDMADGTPDQIDGNELTGYIRRTLKIVNALQA